MPNFYDQYFGWGEEANWGTPVARTKFIRAYKGTFLRQLKPRDPTALLGKRDPERMFEKLGMAIGKAIIPLAYVDQERIWKHALGAIVDAGAGPFTHTATLTDGPPFTGGSGGSVNGLTGEAHAALPNAGFEAWVAEGLKIQTIGGNWRINEEAKLELDVLGEQALQGPKTASPTFIDLDNFTIKPSQIVLTVDGTSINVYGVQWSLNNNQTDDRGFLGQANIAEPVAKDQRTITGTIDREWETGTGTAAAKTLYDKFFNGTPASIQIQATKDANNQFTLLFNNVIFTGETPEPEMGGRQNFKLPFTCLLDAANTAMKVTAKNNNATS